MCVYVLINAKYVTGLITAPPQFHLGNNLNLSARLALFNYILFSKLECIQNLMPTEFVAASDRDLGCVQGQT